MQEIIKVGNYINETSQCGVVVSTDGISPTICACCHGYANANILECKNNERNK